MKQCKFYDKETDTVHNGIMLDSDMIICACCGCTIEPGGYKLLKVYDTWINFSDYIDDGEPSCWESEDKDNETLASSTDSLS